MGLIIVFGRKAGKRALTRCMSSQSEEVAGQKPMRPTAAPPLIYANVKTIRDRCISAIQAVPDRLSDGRRILVELLYFVATAGALSVTIAKTACNA